MRRTVIVAAALAGFVACRDEGSARAPGAARTARAWAASGFTGPMHGAHNAVALARLADGRVLAADETGSELYDPATDAWTETGAMGAARIWHVLVTLADGRVLAAGGNGLASAELFDPTAGTWTPTGSMGVARSYAVGARLPDGRVLVAGGYGVDGLPVATAELYDPTNGTWTPTAAPPDHAAVEATATSLADGRVLLAGAYGVETYDPATGAFTALTAGAHAQWDGAAVALPDGRVLLAGGQLAYVDVLDPTTGALSPAPALDSPMWYPAYALDGNGQAVLLGGTDAAGVTLTVVRRYGEAAAAWIEGAPLLQSRTRAQAVALDDGTILVAGGAQRAVAGAPSELIPLDRLAERVAAPSCGPAACAPGACGDTLDSCGAVVACGTCAPGLTCTAAHTCACVPTTCAAQGAACGTLADGCGGSLECGTCSGGLTCSAGACVDAAPPTVRIVSPEDGAIVGGNVTIRVSASDDVGVTRTALYVGSVKIGEQVGPGPYTFTWSTAYYGYGTWPLVAESRDAAGHVSRSAAVNATLLNPYATYDATLKAPRCPVTADCRSGDLVTGRSTLGPEKNSPNTVGGTCFDGTAGTFHCTYTGCESLDSVRIHSVDGGPLAPGKAVEVEAEVWAISSYDVLTVYSAPNAGQPVWTQVARVSPTSSGSVTVRATFTLPTGSLQAIRGQFGLGAQSSACSGSPYADQDDLVFGVQTGPDRTPPVAALGAPAGGATLTGPVTVTASATDDVGVTRVELYLDGVTLLKTWFGAPYSTSWDPRTVPVGSHQLSVRAFDAAGNVGQSTPVAVNVVRDQIAPTVSFVSPASGATLSGNVTVKVSASDDYGVAVVDFYVDGAWIGSSYQPPSYPFYVVTTNRNNGPHTIEARASDLAGNVGVAQLPVTIANDRTAPVVSVTAPVAGSTVTGAVALQASASDDTGVTKVEFYVDGALVGSATAAPYAVTWSSGSASSGSHAVTAKAYDAAMNVGTSAAVAITVNNGGAGGAAVYDATLQAPRCASLGASCDSTTLLLGRGTLGPEPNRPNTLSGSACADGGSGSFHSDESLDRLRISTVDGAPFAAGKTVRIDATVWVWGVSDDSLDLYTATDARSPSWTFLGTLAPTGTGSQTLSKTFVLGAGSLQAIRGVFRYRGSASPCGSGGYDDRDDLVFAVQ